MTDNYYTPSGFIWGYLNVAISNVKIIFAKTYLILFSWLIFENINFVFMPTKFEKKNVYSRDKK